MVMVGILVDLRSGFEEDFHYINLTAPSGILQS